LSENESGDNHYREFNSGLVLACGLRGRRYVRISRAAESELCEIAGSVVLVVGDVAGSMRQYGDFGTSQYGCLAESQYSTDHSGHYPR
jgi:hypothetical protein